MKTGSRSRLTRYTARDFPSDSLRDALGRAVSEAECLPRKEFFEAWETARRIRRVFRGGPVVELAGGHGLLSHMLLLLDRTSPHAVVIDRRRPASFERLHEVLVARWPHLAGRVRYREEKIKPSLEVEPEALVVAVHACGNLTDRALDVALAARARVAVLPCCQVTKEGTSGLEGWIEPRLAVDITRLFRLRDASYRVLAKQIPAEITPQNRLLLGEPAPAAAETE